MLINSNYHLSEKKTHLLFLFILSLNYIIPLLIFNNITLFYIDTLDHDIVYNLIIGKILRGDFEAVKIFLNGEIKIEYLRRLFQPYIILYGIFNVELAYWLVDVLAKLTAYFSFFILANKINKNLFISGLISCLYASINLPTHIGGFGLAIFPYIFYLVLYKSNLELKHYVIIFFFGLNTDLVANGLALPILAIATLFFINKKNIVNFFTIFTIFSCAILIANWNLVFIAFQSELFHRVEFIRESSSFYETIIFFIKSLLYISHLSANPFLIKFPYTLFIVPLLIAVFFSKQKEVKVSLFLVIITAAFLALLKYNLIAEYINESEGFLKTFSWHYLNRSFVFLYAFSIIYILKNKNFYTKSFMYLICLSIFLFQVNSSIIPFVKDKILKIDSYQNFYTFKGYYYFYDYDSIKKIVKNKRTISFGLDPMVAVFHDINVIDGYHTIYPLSYKKKFRKIIEKELNANSTIKKYYDNWGSRLYATYSGKDNIQVNFKEAKKLGAEFVISKFILNSKDLNLIKEDCIKKGLCLYRIN
tara:strand:- start:5681 stop:7276 length:1596 start_codon:yes stop_codon:yes gene_type:complete